MNRVFLHVSIIILVCTTIFATLGVASVNSTSNIVAGTITAQESGLVLVNGSISIGDLKVPITNGRFTAKNIPLGRQQIVVEGAYRKNLNTTITVSPGTNTVNLALEPIFTKNEIEMLAKIIRAEAEGESQTGQIAVAATVLNRVTSDHYPTTINEVVYQKINGRYQYSPVQDGRINLPPREQDYTAAYHALTGQDPSLGATGFFNAAKTADSWVRSHPVTTQIGNHTFFSY